MAAGILEGREALTTQLQRQLAILASYVSLAGQNNLSSSHVVAETTMVGLLNRVCGWQLVNANVISQNYPGVDLIDAENSIAVQVTANQTVKKVRETLEKAGKKGVIYGKLIVLFLTNEPPTAAMKTCTVPAYSGPVEVWNLADVLRFAKELDPVRLNELTEYMEAELGTIEDRVKELPHLELPPVSALPPTGFVGREPELEEISRRFAQGDKTVVLTGLGGMGKTELAVRYGRKHPGMVYFIRFDTSFARTLANMAQGIRPRLSNEELRLEEAILRKKVLNLLEQSRPEDLLIIDNADSPTGALADLKDEGYKLLRELPLKLLLTTRSDAPRSTAVEPMPDEPLIQIFRNHGAELTDGEMTDLIRAVNGHTLTIDLIARTLADNWTPVSAREMLDAIENTTMADEDFPEVGTDYNQDQDPEQLHIYQLLRRVFRVADIPPVEKQVLKCAVLLPDDGMDVRLFRKGLSGELLRAFPRVGKQGWLSAEHQKLTIHPVIRLVCLTELKPTEADCGEFLDALWTQFDPKDYRRDQYTQMAELFTAAHDRLGSPDGRWLNWSGILWNELGESQKLHDLYHARLSALEQTLPADSTELATAYNYYGIALDDLGDYSSGLNYSEKALSIRLDVLPEDAPDLARSYTNVGSAYGSLGNHRKALEYQQKGLSIFIEKLSPDDPDLAIACNNVGGTYGDLGDHKKALEYQMKALTIREKVLPPDHPDLATSYNSVGLTYGDLGDHNKALKYSLKALTILEKVLPPDHPNLAAAYNNVGILYGALGNHNKAQEFQLKALAIREKVLPPDHPDLATSYSNLSYIYGQLGDRKNELECDLKALAIRKKVLPADHPDLAASYNNMGLTYGQLGDHKKELEYQLKALAIWEKVLPPDHPNLATSCNNVACTYHGLGDLQSAAKYMRRAAGIISRSSLPKTHPKRVNYPKRADELEAAARMQQDILAKMQGFGPGPFPFGKK